MVKWLVVFFGASIPLYTIRYFNNLAIKQFNNATMKQCNNEAMQQCNNLTI